MDPDEERKRKAREKDKRAREKKRAKMTEEELQIEKEKLRERMKKYSTKPRSKEYEAEKWLKRKAKLADRKNETAPKMTHHGAKPLAHGVPEDADQLMGNFVFPVESEPEEEDDLFLSEPDEEFDDFLHQHNFDPGSGGAGMAMAF